jgi:plastocyanin
VLECMTWIAAFLAATFLPGAVRAEDAAVVIDDFAFSPPSLTVKAGTTVTLRNTDDIPYTVASVTRLSKSKALDTEDSYSFTFNEPGNYEQERSSAIKSIQEVLDET